MEYGPDLTNADWRKSSYSGSTGGDCVECTVTGGAAWRKSSYSGNTGGDCVEVADASTCGSVPVRDSKNPTGPAIVLGAHAWQTFVNDLR
ncbi:MULTISPECIES: DUF397 domain-containing protein [Streptomyces]|uniref:DUF397 domain-containing protein n=1 Tax=Streptomyces TaxID=1883 RepID=UPI00168AA596|nr:MULTISPECIES: DUF397 domain-containing protein [Streptomyces]MBD3545655.1 DUF397 domain-containing protein [Streptomyces sp. JV180]MDW4913303.1 DUF397 domain-containing protein [Streptomyces californicus]